MALPETRREERVEQVVLGALVAVRLVGLDARGAAPSTARKDPSEEVVERAEGTDPPAEDPAEDQREPEQRRRPRAGRDRPCASTGASSRRRTDRRAGNPRPAGAGAQACRRAPRSCRERRSGTGSRGTARRTRLERRVAPTPERRQYAAEAVRNQVAWRGECCAVALPPRNERPGWLRRSPRAKAPSRAAERPRAGLSSRESAPGAGEGGDADTRSHLLDPEVLAATRAEAALLAHREVRQFSRLWPMSVQPYASAAT